MNTKSVLIATLFAAVAGSAFASDYTATAGNPEVQIAQSTARSTVRASVVAGARSTPRSDEVAAAPAGKADTRTRAEVRAETAAYNNGGEARAARLLYIGGAQ